MQILLSHIFTKIFPLFEIMNNNLWDVIFKGVAVIQHLCRIILLEPELAMGSSFEELIFVCIVSLPIVLNTPV